MGQPQSAPSDPHHDYARPDDPAADGRTWRARLLAYNESGANPLDLLPAYMLYAHQAYRHLVEAFGLGQVFILSAGWGLIPASFLTPKYDITFSASAEPWQRRRRSDPYQDFRIIPDDSEELVFIGSKDYLPLFCRLSTTCRGVKTILYNAARTPELPPDFRAVRFETGTRTNWHYEAAAALVAGKVNL